MSRAQHTGDIAHLGVPRASGDEPDGVCYYEFIETCSPRERG